MSFCAASCCTCSPRASSAFATLDSSPTGDVPLCCRFAPNCSARDHPRPNQKPPPPIQPARFGAAPSVGGRCWSSNDLPLPNSNSVLHPLSLEPPHETTTPSSRTRGPSPPAGVLRPACPQTSPPSPTSAKSPAPTPRKLQPNHSRLHSFQHDRGFRNSSTPLNTHKRLPTGGSLQTAVSDAPR